KGGGSAVCAAAESAGAIDGADGRRRAGRRNAIGDVERAGDRGFRRGVRTGGAGDGGGIREGGSFARPFEAAAGRWARRAAREWFDGGPSSGQSERELRAGGWRRVVGGATGPCGVHGERVQFAWRRGEPRAGG